MPLPDPNTFSYQVVPTADGSNTVRLDPAGIHYHSIHGALTESLHVFVKEGLDWWKAKHPRQDQVRVFEMGFGTGLNAALAVSWAEANHMALAYTGLEAYPLPAGIFKSMAYGALVNGPDWDYWMQVYEDWNREKQLSWQDGAHTFTVHPLKLENFEEALQVDIIFFDAFAKTAQEELWSEWAMHKLAAMLRPGGVFISYGITGHVKRALIQEGLEAERPKGAPGKRHMLRAYKPLQESSF